MKISRHWLVAISAITFTLVASYAVTAGVVKVGAPPNRLPGAPKPAEPPDIDKQRLPIITIPPPQVKADQGSAIIVGGPQTRGERLTIAGRDVQLPADAHRNYVLSGDCAIDNPRCRGLEYPYSEIVRGRARVGISERSGRVLYVSAPSGEENAFDFLRPVFSFEGAMRLEVK